MRNEINVPKESLVELENIANRYRLTKNIVLRYALAFAIKEIDSLEFFKLEKSPLNIKKELIFGENYEIWNSLLEFYVLKFEKNEAELLNNLIFSGLVLFSDEVRTSKKFKEFLKNEISKI